MNTIDTDKLINFLLQQKETEKFIELKTAYNVFMDYLKLHNRKGTINAYKTDLKFIYSYFHEMNLTRTNQITTDVIDKYVNKRINHVKPVTVNKEITTLKIMYNRLIKNNYIDKIPFTYNRLKQAKPIIDEISFNDIKKIIELFKSDKTIFDYNKLAFMLMLTTGIRTNELVNIKTANVDLEKNSILLDFTKNGKARFIYIVDNLKDLIKKQMKNNNIYLFENITCNSIRNFFKRLKKKLNIDVLSPHKLRHYYATNIYSKTNDIFLVMNLLGHSDIKMTQIYLNINNQENQRKNNLYNPINDF